jgi:hypothetical protein
MCIIKVTSHLSHTPETKCERNLPNEQHQVCNITIDRKVIEILRTRFSESFFIIYVRWKSREEKCVFVWLVTFAISHESECVARLTLNRVMIGNVCMNFGNMKISTKITTFLCSKTKIWNPKKSVKPKNERERPKLANSSREIKLHISREVNNNKKYRSFFFFFPFLTPKSEQASESGRERWRARERRSYM